MMDMFQSFSEGEKFSLNKFNQIAKKLGEDDLDKKDLKILTEALDFDHDGTISTQDLYKTF